MRKTLVGALLLLSISLPLHAAWFATLYGEYSGVDPSMLSFISAPDGTRFSVGTDWASYNGHYGDYIVNITKYDKNVTLRLYGKGESKDALQKEILWIKDAASVPDDTCTDFAIHDELNGKSYFCDFALEIYTDSPVKSSSQSMPPIPGTATGTDDSPPALPETSASANSDAPPAPPDSAGAVSSELPPSPPVEYAPASVAPPESKSGSGFVEQLSSELGGVVDGIYAAAGMQRTEAGASSRAPTSQTGAGETGALGASIVFPVLVAILLVIIASFLLLSARPEPPIVAAPDPAIERLLQNETRAGILEELSSAEKIPTHLSNKLGVSKPAIVNHLSELIDAGLVEKIEEDGKKFVYYRLTQKGRQILLARAG